MLPIIYKQIPVAIDGEKCSKCRICVSLCECFSYNGSSIEVNTTSCKGCGICIASCPSSAIYHVYDDAFFYEFFEKEEARKFECDTCSYEYMEEEGKLIFCEKRFDMGKAVEAISNGKDVIVKKCLFSEEKIEGKSRKLAMVAELLKAFKMEDKLKVK
ncbi:hypothetical protein B6U81_03370 [Thermoplasmatales archaeon ex4484_30]|nr:MAG: hypothetical protein FE041_00440 [Thermoplasmata archaeon]OYT61259.1 MAG: hypothetical protein B6U81_03370 [Thermoplasmatales archaeon ex4484_30]